jgi:excisionase family DNA binding protein
MAQHFPYRAGRVPAYLTPGEVAALYRVDPKTVTKWAKEGKVTSIRTPGGHRRFAAVQFRDVIADLTGAEPVFLQAAERVSAA